MSGDWFVLGRTTTSVHARVENAGHERGHFGLPVVDDVPMVHRNVDHVAVSPRAVLAIETKYVRRCWSSVGD
jgi:hypothetical protein